MHDAVPAAPTAPGVEQWSSDDCETGSQRLRFRPPPAGWKPSSNAAASRYSHCPSDAARSCAAEAVAAGAALAATTYSRPPLVRIFFVSVRIVPGTPVAGCRGNRVSPGL